MKLLRNSLKILLTYFPVNKMAITMCQLYVLLELEYKTKKIMKKEEGKIVAKTSHEFSSRGETELK